MRTLKEVRMRLWLIYCLALTGTLQADSKPLVDVLRDYHQSAEKQQGWSELAYAIKKGYISSSDKMIRNGINPDEQVHDNLPTPFIVAIECGYPSLVQRMIDYKADVNKIAPHIYDACMPQLATDQHPGRNCGPDAYSPLMVAIQAKQPEIAAILLANGADPTYRSRRHYQPIHLAIRHQQIETLQRLLDKGVNVNSQDMWGYTPLHYCAFLGDSSMAAKLATLLLERGADANVHTGTGNYQFSPLHIAALHGHTDLVQSLLARNGDVNGEDSQGATPLWRAASSSAETRDIVRGLIRARADMNKINNRADERDTATHLGASILAVAILNHNIDIAELLLQNGAQANIVDFYGKTPLIYAVANNDDAAVELLLSYKADPNLPGTNNKTPMEMAYNSQQKEIFERLVQAHAEQLYK